VVVYGPVSRKAFPSRRVVLINEEELHISKAEGYKGKPANSLAALSMLT
jgi:hypothetical protein